MINVRRHMTALGVPGVGPVIVKDSSGATVYSGTVDFNNQSQDAKDFWNNLSKIVSGRGSAPSGSYPFTVIFGSGSGEGGTTFFVNQFEFDQIRQYSVGGSNVFNVPIHSIPGGTSSVVNTSIPASCQPGYMPVPPGYVQGVTPLLCPDGFKAGTALTVLPDGSSCYTCVQEQWYENKWVLIGGGVGLLTLVLLLRK